MTRFPAIPALAALRSWPRRAVPASAPAFAKSNFDGTWSVLIVTQKGTCDRAYRYPVKIDNGSVGYAGDASFTVSGKVGDNGAVTVKVARGSQSANGTGRCRRPTARACGPPARATARAPGRPSAARPDRPSRSDSKPHETSRILNPAPCAGFLRLRHRPVIQLPRNRTGERATQTKQTQHPAETGVG